MSELETAAQALVRAACLDMKVKSDTEGIEKTVGAIEKSAAKMDMLDESINNKLNTVNQHLKVLHNKLEEALTNSEKKRSLEFAFENASFGSFLYVQPGGRGGSFSSADLVKKAILSFRRGKGSNLPNGATLFENINHSTEVATKEFQDAFAEQVASLIGKEPRISLGSDQKSYAIYYE